MLLQVAPLIQGPDRHSSKSGGDITVTVRLVGKHRHVAIVDISFCIIRLINYWEILP